MPDRYFSIRYQANGKRKEEGLGWASSWSAENKKLTPETAALVLEKLKTAARMGEGETRLSERREKQQMEREAWEKAQRAPTMTDLWVEYQKALARRKKPKSPGTIREEQRKFDKIIQPALGDIKVRKIKRADIAVLLNSIADSTPVLANRLHSQLSIMFKTALDLGWLEVHPMYMMSKPGGAEPPCDRFLNDEEIRAVWPWINTLRPNPRDILKLIIMTAQRPGEVQAMRWSDISFTDAVWTLGSTKTGAAHLVPLSAPVLEILKARQRGDGYSAKQLWMVQSEFVFPSNYNKAKGASTGHAGSTKKAREQVHKRSGVASWTAHDLRRTARTIMSRLQIKQHIRERVLNHSQGGMVGVYDQYDYLIEKAAALDKLGAEVMRIVGNSSAGNVVQIRRAG